MSRKGVSDAPGRALGVKVTKVAFLYARWRKGETPTKFWLRAVLLRSRENESFRTSGSEWKSIWLQRLKSAKHFIELQSGSRFCLKKVENNSLPGTQRLDQKRRKRKFRLHKFLWSFDSPVKVFEQSDLQFHPCSIRSHVGTRSETNNWNTKRTKTVNGTIQVKLVEIWRQHLQGFPQYTHNRYNSYEIGTAGSKRVS